MSRLMFDISKMLLIVLVMHLIVFNGKSLLSHVIGLFYCTTWVAIVQEIFQHKLKYLGNICCLVFVICVARRINCHGRPRSASKTMRHTSVKHASDEGDSFCIALVKVDQDKSVECKASSSSSVYVDSLIDSSHQTQPDESRDTSNSSSSSKETHPVIESAMQVTPGSEVGPCVDVVSNEQKAVAVPVRLTKTRILVAAGVVGLGGYLCWRLLKK